MVSIYDAAISNYRDLMYINTKLYKELRESDDKGVKRLLNEFYQRDTVMGMPGDALAMDFVNMLSPRYYFNGIDITDAMREKIYLEEYGKDDSNWDFVVRSLLSYEEHCFEAYKDAITGANAETLKTQPKYAEFLKSVKAMNEFIGSDTDSDKPWVEDVANFRRLVKDAITLRRKIQIIVNFRQGMLPKEYRDYYQSRESMNYSDALDLCELIIDNVESINPVDRDNFDKHTEDYFVEQEIEVDDIWDWICNYDDDGTAFNEDGIQGLIGERFITNYLKKAGVTTELYTRKYQSDPMYTPDKKLCVALALFLEPNSTLDSTWSEDDCVLENVERFMNQNGQSIQSGFATVSKYDELTDGDLRLFLKKGLSIDIILYLMNRFAKTPKNF